jgi:hypothetical protein
MHTAAMINDYERLRAAALKSTPGTGKRLTQLLSGGLHAWLMTRSGAESPPVSPGVSRGRTIQLTQRHDIVQLLASMTLQFLTEDANADLQRQ